MRQFEQRERLRYGLLLVGADHATRRFTAGNVEVDGGVTVKFCKTPGHCTLDGPNAIPQPDVNEDMFSDSITQRCDIPSASGMYMAVGRVRVDPSAGKPTLMIEIERYIPMDQTKETGQDAVPAHEELELVGAP